MHVVDDVLAVIHLVGADALAQNPLHQIGEIAGRILTKAAILAAGILEGRDDRLWCISTELTCLGYLVPADRVGGRRRLQFVRRDHHRPRPSLTLSPSEAAPAEKNGKRLLSHRKIASSFRDSLQTSLGE
ncbi:hypothetical protein [Mesorhizobium sp. Root102]|uniref:hypothetical protein n=1 Tax=Mesorhizobium sp. Root102 TaxID=1736422 RepID=UPI000A862314|nr:hypothetical protein [Mesorhizobium sp. Root102]